MIHALYTILSANGHYAIDINQKFNIDGEDSGQFLYFWVFRLLCFSLSSFSALFAIDFRLPFGSKREFVRLFGRSTQ